MPILFIAIIAILFLSIPISRYFSRDVVSVKSAENLKADAKITNISHKKVGTKGSYSYRTTILFEDGFVFEANDTQRTDHLLHYEIRVDQKMQDEMIARAKEAHAKVCEQHGLVRPQKPYVCGNCGQKGPYDNMCPQCGSSLKKYIE